MTSDEPMHAVWFWWSKTTSCRLGTLASIGARDTITGPFETSDLLHRAAALGELPHDAMGR